MSKMAQLADAQAQIERLERENAALRGLIRLQAQALKEAGLERTATELRRAELLVAKPRLSLVDGGAA